MAFVTIEDRYAEIEVIVFPKQLARFEDVLFVDSVISVSGTVSVREDEPPKILLNSCAELPENSKKETMTKEAPTKIEREEPRQKERRVYLRVPGIDSKIASRVLSFIEIFPGDTPVYFFDTETKKYIKINNIGLSLNSFTEKELCELIGKENFAVR